MTHSAHERAASGLQVRVAVLTLSDTRTRETDVGGSLIVERVTAAGHDVRDRRLIRDDADALRAVLREWLAGHGIDAILTTGGTGIARRDGTIDVVTSMLDVPMPGFGELFRALSFAEIGPAAMMSRAVAGVASGKFVAALPGSPHAVELALARLLLPQLRHIVSELQK